MNLKKKKTNKQIIRWFGSNEGYPNVVDVKFSIFRSNRKCYRRIGCGMTATLVSLFLFNNFRRIHLFLFFKKFQIKNLFIFYFFLSINILRIYLKTLSIFHSCKSNLTFLLDSIRVLLAAAKQPKNQLIYDYFCCIYERTQICVCMRVYFLLFIREGIIECIIRNNIRGTK